MGRTSGFGMLVVCGGSSSCWGEDNQRSWVVLLSPRAYSKRPFPSVLFAYFLFLPLFPVTVVSAERATGFCSFSMRGRADRCCAFTHHLLCWKGCAGFLQDQPPPSLLLLQPLWSSPLTFRCADG